MNRYILLGVFASVFAALPAAFAHHGPGQFNGGDVEVTGVLTDVRFVNPHGYIYFDSVDEQGNPEAWRCELQAGSLLKRAGWTEDLFPIGGKITVTGSAGTNERTACALDRVQLPDGTTLDRYGQLAEQIDAAFGSDDRLVDGKLDLNGSWAAPQRQVTVGNGAAADDGPAAGGMGPGGPRGGGPRGLPGGITALTEAGTAAAAAMPAGNPRHSCLATNIFHDWEFDRHVNEIVHTEETIVLKYGLMDIERTIYLNMDEHPDNIEPSVAGHSIGKWEDVNTLVVDTTGFVPGVLSSGSAMYSEQFHATERFTYDPETQGLTRDYTAVDPLYFTGTYSGQDVVYPSNVPFEPYDCVELKDEFIEPI